jgi:hypothetical protein
VPTWIAIILASRQSELDTPGVHARVLSGPRRSMVASTEVVVRTQGGAVSYPALTRARTPKYLNEYWGRGAATSTLVGQAAAHVIDSPVVLPLTRLSGSLVYPVLSGSQLETRRSGNEAQLDIVLVSASPPRRALDDLLQLRAYGHCIVLLSQGYPRRFFDLAELDLRGIGVAQAQSDGNVSQLIGSEGISVDHNLEPWWRAVREHQLLVLASR